MKTCFQLDDSNEICPFAIDTETKKDDTKVNEYLGMET